ncbi:MAG: helix-turn-helix domain-containing protein [Acidimicrobiia bacterium]|nr:helix-turn-helix domain-containing protein [Acidimicrobiia bacterium]
MTTEDIERSIGDLAAALGDSTRRGIYVSVRESADPMTASRIAELFDIHPNVARHHLDRLVDDGYLRVSDRRDRDHGAGRPAKGYEATDKEILVSYPARRYDLLAELLIRVIRELDAERAPAVAERVGRAYAQELAGEIGMPEEEGVADAITAVSRAMMGVGFGTTPQADDRVLLTNHCPFGRTASDHPEVVCKLDQGIVAGLLEAAGAARGVPVRVTPQETPQEACITEFHATSRSG